MRKRATRAPLLARKRGDDTLWNWVFSEVSDPVNITKEHILSAYGFAPRNASSRPICPNKLTQTTRAANHLEDSVTAVDTSQITHAFSAESDALEVQVAEDKIHVPNSLALCSRNVCLANPNCVNHLGQDLFQDEGWCIALIPTPRRFEPAPPSVRLGSFP